MESIITEFDCFACVARDNKEEDWYLVASGADREIVRQEFQEAKIVYGPQNVLFFRCNEKDLPALIADQAFD